MTKPLSLDLRERIVDAVEGGGAVRVVGARFRVSASAVSKIHRRWRATGSVAPAKMGGDRRSGTMEGEADWLLSSIKAEPDLTLDELREALRERGLSVGIGTVWRFFERHDIRLKKNRARRRAGATGRGRGADRVAPAPECL